MYRGIFGDFLPKNLFHGENFGGNLWGGVVAHRGTYDQIMSGWELYKCIFE